MGGTGAGVSPEDLFVAAAASSYSTTLAEMLRAARLPQTSLAVHAEGLVAGDPGAVRFTSVTVRPTIQAPTLRNATPMRRPPSAARNYCFIDRSIRGNIAYLVGDVVLVESVK